MTTLRQMLKDADPLRREPSPDDGPRDRLRRVVVTAASEATTAATPRLAGRAPAWFLARGALLAGVLLTVVAGVVVGSRLWSTGGTTVQAAVRFEVRLAEAQPAHGLREARIAGSDRVVYLHQEVVVTNGDIAKSLVERDAASRFEVTVRFTEAGTRKMREATVGHIGRPVAILIDGSVVMAPVLRSPIGDSAVISGDYTRAEAERIAEGIRAR